MGVGVGVLIHQLKTEENRMTESEGLLLSDCADLVPCFL